MRTKEVNNSLIGKRVKGIFTAMEVTGTIIGIVEERSPWGPSNEICSKGVRIKLDKPVRWGSETFTQYESTARVSDEFGNLHHTEIIEEQ